MNPSPQSRPWFRPWYLMTALLVQMLLWPLAQAEIVSPEWLKSQMNDREILILDVREPREFHQGHIQGSVNIPPMSLFAEGYFMPPLGQMRELFSSAGVDEHRRVVALDNGEFIWAARLYWLLETLGHEHTFLLDTAYGHWEPGLFNLSTEAETPDRRTFVPMVDNERFQTKLGTLAAIGRNPILDGRAELHYLGQESTASRYGHIPTAQHSPCTRNYEVTPSGTRLRDLTALADLYSHLPRDQQVILYCDGGAEAALNYVVLRALGYEAAVYDGSWLEWGNDPALPIVNPSE